MLEVTPIPCLKDNYSYAVRKAGSSEVVIVDACEEAPIVEHLESRGLHLSAILSTHHHHDHVGGNLALARRYSAPIYGFVEEAMRIIGMNRPLQDGEQFSLMGYEWMARHVPGHTKGALCYVVEERAFTGDTLFVGGCGRLFEGTPAQMHASLRRIAALPEETLLYTGHEYAHSNLRFAAHILPGDAKVRARFAEVTAAHERSQVTAVTTVREELATNLFLRVEESTLRVALAMHENASPVEVFAELRRRKNEF